MSREFYVYIYLNPLKQKQPFYIGMGKGKRMYDHLKEKNPKNLHKSNTIKQIRSETGNDPPIEIYHSNLTKEEARFLEKELISFYGRADTNTGILTNHTDGGEGGNGILWTPEQRQRYREMYTGKNNPNYNNKWSDELKKKLSVIRKNKYKNGYQSPTLGIKRNDLSERNKKTKGYVWVNKNSKAKQINPEILPQYISEGWEKGMGKISSYTPTSHQ